MIPFLPRLVVTLNVGRRRSFAVGTVLRHHTISVIIERTHVMGRSRALAFPVLAGRALALYQIGHGLGQEVVLVLSVIIPIGSKNWLLDDVLPS